MVWYSLIQTYNTNLNYSISFRQSKKMTNVTELDPNYSITRYVIRTEPRKMSEKNRQSCKSEDKLETVSFGANYEK